MYTSLFVLLRTLKIRLKTFLSCSVLASFRFWRLYCTSFPLRSLPGCASWQFTGSSCWKTFERREVPPAKGGEDEHPRLVAALKNDNAECCIDINGVEAGCLQMEDLKSEMAEDGWAEMYGSLEGKLGTGEENSGGGEDGWSFQIDSLAEELWNCYFGRYSSWQYKRVDVQGW